MTRQKIVNKQIEIHNCKEIGNKSPSFFFQKGKGVSSKILILGESLPKNGWMDSGKAFYAKEDKLAPTGKKLNEELAVLNLSVEDCSFTEIAKCYIGSNRKILKPCGLLCGEHLFSQIKHYKIRLILSLGVITKDILEKLFGIHLAMGEINQANHKDKKFFILPLYHPSPASPYGHKRNLNIIRINKKGIKNVLTKKNSN
jgi:uracil-DNA glycosylase family 4